MIEEKVIITGWFKDHLCLYTEKNWEKLIEKWKGLFFDRWIEVRKLVFARSMEVELDGRGRILIPDYLRKHANLGEKVIVISNRHLEIWNWKAGMKKIARRK